MHNHVMSFIYRIINNLSPELLAGTFEEKTTKYSLRSKSTLQLPKACKTTTFGTNSKVAFCLPNSYYKDIKTETAFKLLNKKWKPKACTCTICN